MIRAFFGISISQAVTQQLLKEYSPIQQQCHGNLAGVNPSLFHVTVKFINLIDPESLALLSDYAQELSTQLSPFTLSIKKISVFPRVMGRVVAAYVVPHPSLLRLHQALDSKALEMGVSREGRRYRPHITLGKFVSAPCGLATPRVIKLTLPVGALMLYESRPGPSGSHYIPLRCFPFLK